MESMHVGRYGYSCKYPGCASRYHAGLNDKHFFKFPANSSIQVSWKKFCKIPEETNCLNFRLCEDHFVESDFYSSARARLLKYSIPSLPHEAYSVSFEHSYAKHPSSQQACSSNSQEPSTTPAEIPEATSQDHLHEILVEPSPISDYQEELPMPSTSTMSNFNLEPTVINFDFLTTEPQVESKGFLRAVGLMEKDLTPTKSKMYSIHKRAVSKISKLRGKLENQRHQVKTLQKLYDNGKFQLIETDLNDISKEFINSQLRNVNKAPTGRRWSVLDKSFSLAMYKRSPRLYRYLANYFFLPSPRTLKLMLNKIPFDTGVNPIIMDCLRQQVEKMNPLDRYCVILFDEMKLDVGFHYEHHKSYISGFVDLGQLGRQGRIADHSLVFMARGIRKNWKQVIAYYFTSKTIATIPLKTLLGELIHCMQQINLKVVATVCDQGPTNQAALRRLVQEDTAAPDDNYTFAINGEPIAVIYDVPHLLKNTRNALLRCGYRFDHGTKFAKFEFIESAFNLDRSNRTYKMLTKLKPEYFNFKDSWVKMKVKVAARQLSFSVAAAIETFVSLGTMSPEGAQTAEFVHKIDSLFDSLNGYSLKTSERKPLRSVLKEGSPHLQFWSEMLTDIRNWRLIDLNTGTDVTREYDFISGWLTTIRSIRFLWNSLHGVGFNYFNLRSFNQDPLENLFSIIRQHGISNTNPTCHHFVAALKASVVNNLSTPITNGNCENDDCSNLNNLTSFLESNGLNKTTNTPSSSSNLTFSSHISSTISDEDMDLDDERFRESNFIRDLLETNPMSPATSYVAGYILKKIPVPDCQRCREDIFSSEQNESHLFITFKEFSDSPILTYPSDKVIQFVEAVDILIQKFLQNEGHIIGIEEKFAHDNYAKFFSFEFCSSHNIRREIFNKCVRLCIYKFIREKKNEQKSRPPTSICQSLGPSATPGHSKKMAIFTNSRNKK